MKTFICLAILFIFSSFSIIAQIVYGTNGYIEYHPGDLPIVISVPHGGFLEPISIPDRTCNNPVMVADAHTLDLGKQIDSSIFDLTGCHPHMIYCNLKRSKLDCNRNENDGACGNSEAIISWNEFQKYIDSAQNLALQQHGEKVYYIDLHGHGNSTQRLELGYLLYEDELELSDATLNTSQYINYSSIQHLVYNNTNGSTHTDLLKGDFALGTLFENNGYPAVPSLQDPFPGIGSNYFSGGYNTAQNTSYAIGNMVDGVQIECNYTGVRDTYLNRKSFSDIFASVINEYLNIHMGSQLNDNCGISGLSEIQTQYYISPTVSNGQEAIKIFGNNLEGEPFIVKDLFGKTFFSGKIEQDNSFMPPTSFSNGWYILQVSDNNKLKNFRFCLMHD